MSDAFTRGEIGQAEARTRLKEFLVSQGYDPQQGGLSNLASTGRLNLILEQNARMAYAVGRWQEGMDPDIKERFPCWRYVGSTSAAPRDSHARYAGHVYAKDDPIWHTIFPPSDFGCKCSVEDCDDPAEKAPEDVRPAESGFAFDPAHAFEEFDYDAIKDAALRERTKTGVEKILKEGGRSDPSDRSDKSDGSDKMPAPSNLLSFQTAPDEQKFAMLVQKRTIEEHAEEVRRRVAAEAGNKVFPKDPKAHLVGDDLKRAEEEARKAVPPEAMEATDKKIREIGQKGIRPFLHYSGRPDDSENAAVRKARIENGELDWTGTGVSKARQKAVVELQNLLDVMPKFEGTVYRGCSFDSIEGAEKFLNSLFKKPESLTGFISTTPDPVVAHHYASAGKFKVVIVVPGSRNGVYFGPYSKHPEDEEALISYKFYLRGLQKYERDGIVYVLAEEVPR